MHVALSAAPYHSKGNPCHELPGCCASDEGDDFMSLRMEDGVWFWERLHEALL